MNSFALQDMVPHHVAGLKRLRALAFDIGRNDEMVPPSSVTRLDTVLTTMGVAHTFELFDGTHMNQANQRLTQRLLPFFSRTLVLARRDDGQPTPVSCSPARRPAPSMPCRTSRRRAVRRCVFRAIV